MQEKNLHLRYRQQSHLMSVLQQPFSEWKYTGMILKLLNTRN